MQPRIKLKLLTSIYLFLTAYKKKIGFTGQLLIEPKPKEPTKHQYDYGNMFFL